jgi:hypothetical protein
MCVSPILAVGFITNPMRCPSNSSKWFSMSISAPVFTLIDSGSSAVISSGWLQEINEKEKSRRRRNLNWMSIKLNFD